MKISSSNNVERDASATNQMSSGNLNNNYNKENSSNEERDAAGGTFAE